MGGNELSKLIAGTLDNTDYIRRPENLDWGTINHCKALFRSLFVQSDLTIRGEFKFLPEYSRIIEWMNNPCGKGLMLYGDCGRGKSTIIMGVIPHLLRIATGVISRPIHASLMGDPSPIEFPTPHDKPLGLHYLQFSRFPIIDEVGIETPLNIWGTKHDAFSEVMATAEIYIKPVFISTNLSPRQILERYGQRTAERVIRLCRCIEFKGESLRA